MNKKTNYMATRGIFNHFDRKASYIQIVQANKEVSKNILATLLGKLLPKRNTLRGK